MPQTASARVLLLGTEVTYDTTAAATPTYGVTGVTSGTSQPLFIPTVGIGTVYLRSIGTTSGGTILMEEADWGPWEVTYSGTWSQIASIAASSFTGGAQISYHVTDATIRYFRVRISAAITGGGTILASWSSRGMA